MTGLKNEQNSFSTSTHPPPPTIHELTKVWLVVIHLAVGYHEVCQPGGNERIDGQYLAVGITPDAVVEAQVDADRDVDVRVQPRDELSLNKGHVLGTSDERGVIGGQVAQIEADATPQLCQKTRLIGTDDAYQPRACCRLTRILLSWSATIIQSQLHF